ncbi:hypothetical protein [Clostridium butyricum]|uniref:Putative exonuclease n=1 Tax=Clostridium butyricum E4 str. BoNT E BL5262 TaxID=632245 RepID=C4IE37_CLOBU|nr:hypothetical protein [Clostridium butyricum]EDT73890.1 conserved hypothetical protein [Clostridium butyricum 5521]EEP55321.1 putative exonuclease [Clostridium butyricum E4 str. BoNT E BL5262]NFL31983.1 exonuclease [Clostridium butyricum]NFS18759.1 exonuclease [Clostridium butyricum]
MSGFYIKELVIKGDSVEDARISFEKGLNVINGPSNTGKSFILQCINYVLGAEELKDIKELKGYDKILLEIRSFDDDKPTTLIRMINKNKMCYYLGEVKGFGEESMQELKTKHDPDKEDNISRFLLKKIGINTNKFLVSNAKGKKKTLGFRGIANLSIINETEIISENNSPIFDGQKTNNTYCKSIFRYLLTQKDDMECEEIEDKKIRTAKLDAKIEYANEEIEKLAINQKDIEEKLSELDKNIDISDYKSDVENLEKIIQTKQDELKEKIKIQDELNSKRNRGVILLEKFKLLKKQYECDLKRLSFIQDGDQCLKQININYCPVCNNKVSFDTESMDDVIIACTQEFSKTKKNLVELEETINNLVNEDEALNEKIKLYENDRVSLSKEISLILDNKLKPLKKIIEDTIFISKLKDRKTQIIDEITNIKRDILVFDEKKKEKQSKLDYELNASEKDYNDFCTSIKDTLIDWKYTAVNEVKFDIKDQDIIVDGEKRISNGKGFRAYFYAAFVITLMDYLLDKNYPYTRVLILDSPLTTLKEEEIKKGNIKEDDMINESLQDSMFISIANNCSNKQIIIIENKDIPKEAEGKCNHIVFTKNKEFGRYGFIPERN